MASRASIPIRAVTAAVSLLFCASAFADIDAVAAKKLARKDHCLRCHAVDHKKEGPSYQAIAYKYKDQPDALDKLVKHITIGDRVKLSDGHEEDHKTDRNTSEAELRNLIGWILAQ